MIKIVKKASNKIGCGINGVVNTPLVKKESCINSATAVYYRIECGLNTFICGNGEMRRVS
jgi:hypothetical protein